MFLGSHFKNEIHSEEGGAWARITQVKDQQKPGSGGTQRLVPLWQQPWGQNGVRIWG